MGQANRDAEGLFESSEGFNGGFWRLASGLEPFSSSEAALYFNTDVLVFTGNPAVTSDAAYLPATSSDKLLQEE